MNFKDWTPMKFVDPDLLNQVRLAYVFGKTGQDVFIITENDEVFAWGPNFSKYFVLQNKEPQMKPVRIPELCQQKVIGFAHHSVLDDGTFTCAYTSDRTMFIWGKHLKPQTYTPALHKNSALHGKVTKVASGQKHSLFLNTDGQVVSFGNNDYGQLGQLKADSKSGFVDGDLDGKIVVDVSCGAFFSVAVLLTGEVYTWGSNSDGQLGVNDVSFSYVKSPRKVSALTNGKIEKIICGESYVLAVSDVGELYTWGKNNVGQLGLGDTSPRFKPTKIEEIEKRVIDIAATCYGSTTAAMTEINEVYVWGVCGGMNLNKPTLTQIDNLFDVFAFLASPRVMHKPLIRSVQLGSDSVGETIKNAFGNVETSDLTIVAEDKEIFVHKTILKLRSDYFNILLKEPWSNEDKKTIVINQNYDGLYAYIQYLYSGNFEASPEVTLELLKIADEYNDSGLKKICENRIKVGITVENVTYVYNLALKLDTKDLAAYCVLFTARHIGEIIQTPGFSAWDLDTQKQFIIACHEQRVFKYAK